MTASMPPPTPAVCGQVNSNGGQMHLCEMPAGHDPPHVCWCDDATWTETGGTP